MAPLLEGHGVSFVEESEENLPKTRYVAQFRGSRDPKSRSYAELLGSAESYMCQLSAGMPLGLLALLVWRPFGSERRKSEALDVRRADVSVNNAANNCGNPNHYGAKFCPGYQLSESCSKSQISQLVEP